MWAESGGCNGQDKVDEIIQNYSGTILVTRDNGKSLRRQNNLISVDQMLAGLPFIYSNRYQTL